MLFSVFSPAGATFGDMMENEKNKKSLTPGQITIIAAVAVALLGTVGYMTLKGPSYPPVPTYQELTEKALDLAVKYKGDASKLTPEERNIVDGASMHRESDFMRTGYQLRLKQAAAAAKK